MPTMRRPKIKATKIAYKVMGVPPNLRFKRSKEQSTINKRLLFEETQRVR